MQLLGLLRIASLRSLGTLLGVLVLFSHGEAATLYEKSLASLLVNAEKASLQDFTFVVLGDSRGNDRVFRKSLSLAKRYKPLFILHGGDFSLTGSAEETAHFLHLLDEEMPDIPLFVVIGNHEQRSVFEKEIGPRNYTIDIPRLDMRLVVADNSDYVVEPATFRFLREQLASGRRLTFAALHIPPKTSRWDWHTFSKGADELVALLAEKRIAMAFYGHVHLYDRDDVRGVPSFISGGAGAPLVRNGFPGEPVHHIIVVRVRNGAASAVMVPVER